MSLRELAREAGVSITTASRVINNTALHKVSEHTRRRVLEVARAHRYRPNRQAVSLASGKPPNTIGLVIPYNSHVFDSFYFSQVTAAVADVAAAREMDINLLVVKEQTAERYVDFLSGHRVAGAILLGAEIDAEALRECRDSGTPLVLINNNAPAPGFHTVACNNRGGAREMTRHLLSLGHARIGFIAGPENLLDARERREGYRQGHAEAGVSVDEQLIVAGDYNERSGREAMRRLLALRPRPTAVFAANDQSAIGAMQVAKRAGLRIPDDIALAGFDDIPLAQYLDPPLTTVHQPFYRLGEKAAQVLLDIIRGEDTADANTNHVLRTRLVPRESSGRRSAS